MLTPLPILGIYWGQGSVEIPGRKEGVMVERRGGRVSSGGGEEDEE